MMRVLSMVFGAGLVASIGIRVGVSDSAVGVVTGVVTEHGKAPLPGIRIKIPGANLTVVTDSIGHYRFDRVPVGRVRLVVDEPGFRKVIRTVRIRSGQTTTVDIDLLAGPTSPKEEAEKKANEADRNRAIDAVAATAPIFALGAKGSGQVSRRLADFNTEEYRYISENGWRAPKREPLSTFAIDVDAASYANVRRFIHDGQLPPKDAVRIEEMINYFRYGYPAPKPGEPFSISTEVAPAPWNPSHRLAMIGLQTQPMEVDELPPSNLVFLIDVSGSMNEPTKLPLVKAAFRLLVEQLREDDRVAVVVYAGAAGQVLESTPGSDKAKILGAIDRLEAGGSTAGGAGIQLAYRVARDNFLAHGNNRVILATDGDFNVGASSEGELIRMIEQRKQDGVFLTVLGFGTGNLKDAKMEQLADKGNGHYAYVDDILEARKVFVHELGATLVTVAKDVKIQVEFNPARVKSYRLIGYENRLLADRDFSDDKKDGGEMGAGHSVTALYEIIPADGEDEDDSGVDPLRYQGPATATHESEDWLTVKARYQPPKGSVSKLMQRSVRQETNRPSVDFRFAAAVASFGMVLRESEFRGSATFESVLELARRARGADPEGYRGEFIRLVEEATRLTGGDDRTER